MNKYIEKIIGQKNPFYPYRKSGAPYRTFRQSHMAQLNGHDAQALNKWSSWIGREKGYSSRRRLKSKKSRTHKYINEGKRK